MRPHQTSPKGRLGMHTDPKRKNMLIVEVVVLKFGFILLCRPFSKGERKEG